MLPPAEGTADLRLPGQPSITPEAFSDLATSERVRKGQPLCLIGDPDDGKSHLLIALGTEAAIAGYRVRCVLAAKLDSELVEAADDVDGHVIEQGCCSRN
jgi:DNA replication protein DnaC